MRRLVITPQSLRTDAETQALRNQFANRAHYEYFVDEDALVSGPDGVIARLVTNCLEHDLVRETAKYFRTVSGDLSNRGSVVGEGSMMYRERPDGSLGFTKEVPPSIIRVMRAENTFSDFLGWEHRSPRFPFCRPTAWSLNHPEVLAAAVPFVQAVDRIYREELPDDYLRQRNFMARVSPDFKFHDTSFSTCTVNRNVRTTYHEDANDYRGGMGNLVVLDSDGSGAIVMPHYRIAFLPRPTDVLLMNVHAMHGNLPFTGERLTAILYAREHIDTCGKEDKTTDDASAHRVLETPEEGVS